MKRMALVLMALAVCVMMVAPVAMAGKPGGGGGVGTYSKLNSPPGDFLSESSVGRWKDGNARWFVMFYYASNQLAPGGDIDISHVSITIPGYNNDNPITSIHNDFHGEDLTLPVSISKLAVGDYTTKQIGNIQFFMDLYNYCTVNNKMVRLHINLLSGQFNPTNYEWVNIQVTKTQIHIYSNIALPFQYSNWNSSPLQVLGTCYQNFDITIDK